MCTVECKYCFCMKRKKNLFPLSSCHTSVLRFSLVVLLYFFMVGPCDEEVDGNVITVLYT